MNESTPVLSDSNLIALHVAEYQALTNRSTYWTVIQCTLWSFLLLFFTLVAQSNLYNSTPRFVVWSSLFVVNFIVFSFYSTLIEQYRYIKYIEGHLRSKVKEIFPGASFWEWESWLNERRGKGPQWWEFLPFALSITALVIAVWLQHPLKYQDVFGCIAGFFFILVAGKQAYDSCQIRKQFFMGD